MRTFFVGTFKVMVFEPYPVLIEIQRPDREQTLVLDHTQLADLHYAVSKAIHEAKLLLKDDAKEIGP